MYIFGESGRAFRAMSYFDLSDATNLVIKFDSRDGGTDFTVDRADGVTAPDIDTEVLPEDNNWPGGIMTANHYYEYIITGLEFDKPGQWDVYVQYENNSYTPGSIYRSLKSTFTVHEYCPDPD